MQDDFEKTAAQHLALAAANLTAKPNSSMQQSRDTRARAATMAQASVVHQRGSAVADGVVDSLDLERQVCLASTALVGMQDCEHAAEVCCVSNILHLVSVQTKQPRQLSGLCVMVMNSLMHNPILHYVLCFCGPGGLIMSG